MRKAINFFVVTILLGLITSFIYDGIKHFPFLSSVWNILKWFWKTIFEFEFRVWQILSGIVVLYLAGRIMRITKKQVETKPKFHSYKTDEIDSFKWKWEWAFDFTSKKWYVSNIKPICPKCNTTMHYDYGHFSTYESTCPRCKLHNGQMPDLKDIEAIIIDNVEKGHY